MQVIERKRSLQINYLGFLATKLRDFGDISMLAKEFIQNADDAQASTIRFDLRDDALIVTNDAEFSQCSNLDNRDELACSRIGESQRLCDFHRIAETASGDKRNQDDTTGEKGIGFISVYRFTDHPVLVSRGRQWTFHPEAAESERIVEVSSPAPTRGTEFRLKWATNANSDIRSALKLQAIDVAKLDDFVIELTTLIADAILFLRSVESIEVCRNSTRTCAVQRVTEENKLLVELEYASGQRDLRTWHLFSGNFEDRANELRAEYPHAIESKRKSTINIAIPSPLSDVHGLIFAFLPTQFALNLPLHINADFFTSSDRKSIPLEKNFDGEWNEAAIEAAAELLADLLPILPSLLDYNDLWSLISAIRSLEQDVKKRNSPHALGQFWWQLEPRFPGTPIVFTSNSEWALPTKTFLLETPAEEAALSVFDALGINIVHRDLRRYYSLLLELRVPLLTLTAIADALKRTGLGQPIAVKDAPAFMRDNSYYSLLIEEIKLLTKGATSGIAWEQISACAIAFSTTDQLVPPANLYHLDRSTAEIFADLNSSYIFASVVNPDLVQTMMQSFELEDAIDLLEGVSDLVLETKLLAGDRSRLLKLVGYLASHDLGNANADLKLSIANLPIWPSNDELFPLDYLVIPSGFRDPLGIAKIIDLDVIRPYHHLPELLGAAALTITEYATNSIPDYFASEPDIPAETRRALVELLAGELGHLRDDASARSALAVCELIECTDGTFQSPYRVYFPSKEIKEVLGLDVHIAKLPASFPDSTRSLYVWLGVASDPLPRDIIERVKVLTKSVTTANKSALIRVFTYLGKQWDQLAPEFHTAVSSLKDLAWLPAKPNGSFWRKPSQVYAVYRSYLFETQATFLDIPQPVQGASVNFIKFLGIRSEPTSTQVTAHLRACVAKNIPINEEVYPFLDREATEEDIDSLRDIACLYLKNKGYVRPAHVFWGEHQLGTYRHRLDPSWRKFDKLCSKLDVRESPSALDFCSVLEEISLAFTITPVRPIDETTATIILNCWHGLTAVSEMAPLPSDLLDRLRSKKVVPDNNQTLQLPTYLFFNDHSEFAQMFKPQLVHRLIPLIEGVWPAMQAAGVRSLARSVSIRLNGVEDSQADMATQQRIISRQQLLKRILAAVDPAVRGANSAHYILNRITVSKASAMTLNFRLDNLPAILDDSARAYLDPDTAILYFRRQPEVPWPDIARELARVLSPQSEIGLVASAFIHALSAPDYIGADALLSNLGFPQTMEGKTTPIEEEYFGIGGESSPSTTASESTLIREETPDETSYSHSKGSSPPDNDAETDDSPRQRRQPENGFSGQPSSTTTSRDGTSAHSSSGTNGKLHRTPSRTPKANELHSRRLRSYVAPQGSDFQKDDSETTGTGREDIEAINRAGIDRVLAYEESCGRFPVEQSHNFPGLDILSYDSSTDEVLRYIEVKSCAGNWGAAGVALSAEQFRTGQRYRAEYWLYIVEHALSRTSLPIRIQDPVGKIDLFSFDDGWRAVAEAD
jgi:hypothetical protein